MRWTAIQKFIAIALASVGAGMFGPGYGLLLGGLCLYADGLLGTYVDDLKNRTGQ